MARQRSLLSALADQLNPVRVLRNFRSLAKTVDMNVRTDIPLNRLPSLVRLVSSVDSAETMTVTFRFDYFFGRQKAGRQLSGAEAREDARDGAGRDPHAGAAAAAGGGEDREADLLI
jgi:anionic cell wall polymer biosynthesis LytR-Cps2A-Psr (LCP) family protein